MESNDKAMEALTQISAIATHRFMTDPDFHAKASIAAVWTKRLCQVNGIEFDELHQGTALQAAALATLIAGMSLDGLMDEEHQADVLTSMLTSNLAMENIASEVRHGLRDERGRPVSPEDD